MIQVGDKVKALMDKPVPKSKDKFHCKAGDKLEVKYVSPPAYIVMNISTGIKFTCTEELFKK